MHVASAEEAQVFAARAEDAQVRSEKGPKETQYIVKRDLVYR